MATQEQQTTTAASHEQQHPGVKQYVMIAVILAVLTAIEVAIYYVPALEPVLVPLLLILAIGKFALVVLWFMHLKFDSRLFLRLFVTGLILTISLFAIVLGTFAGRT